MNTETKTYEQMIDSLTNSLNEYNGAMDEDDKIVVPDTIKAIKKTGAINADRLSKMSGSQLEKCGVPPAIAGEFVEQFGKKAEPVAVNPGPSGPVNVTLVTPGDVSAYSPKELVEKYDPANSTNPVGVRLAQVSKGNKFLVFKKDGTVDTEPSIMLLAELDKHPARETYDGRRTFAVGHKPGEIQDEDPIFRGSALRDDGTSDPIEKKWTTAAPHSIRILIAHAVNDTRELRREDAKKIHRLAHTEAGQAELREDCPKAALMQQDREEAGTSLTLKIKVESAAQGNGFGNGNNPFNATPNGNVRF